MAGIQWIKRGGRHEDVRNREGERAGRAEIEEALASPAAKRQVAGPGRSAISDQRPGRAGKETKAAVKARSQAKDAGAAGAPARTRSKRGRAGDTERIRLEFTAPLTPVGPKGAWTGLFLTREQSDRLGSRGRVPVVGTLNGHPIRAFLAPMGDGTHGMMVNKEMQGGAGAKPGDRVRVVLEVDDAPRTVEVPADLKRALARAPRAAATFDRLSYTHQKDYVTWIAEARRPETRARRVVETLRLLAAGKKWKDR